MKQMWNDINQDNLCLLDLIRSLIIVLKTDDLITLVRAGHNNLEL